MSNSQYCCRAAAICRSQLSETLADGLHQQRQHLAAIDLHPSTRITEFTTVFGSSNEQLAQFLRLHAAEPSAQAVQVRKSTQGSDNHDGDSCIATSRMAMGAATGAANAAGVSAGLAAEAWQQAWADDSPSEPAFGSAVAAAAAAAVDDDIVAPSSVMGEKLKLRNAALVARFSSDGTDGGASDSWEDEGGDADPFEGKLPGGDIGGSTLVEDVQWPWDPLPADSK
jgi:hypothetical protein